MKYKISKKKRFGWRGRLVAVLLVVAIVSGILAGTFYKPPKASAAISYIGSSTGTVTTAAASMSLNTPTGISSGNVIVAQVIALPGTSNSVTITAPTGWTLIGTSPSSTKYTMSLYYHVVATGDPTSYSWSFSPNSTATGGMAAFSGVSTKNPIDASASQSNASTTSHTAPSVTASYSNGVVVPFWGFTSNTSAASIDASLTSIYNTNNATNSGIATGYVQLTNAGATGTYTATTAASTASLAETIAFQPAAAAAGVQFVAASTPTICSSACSTTQSIANPSGWKTGDFLVTTVTWQGSVTLTAPSAPTGGTGWTQINSTASSTGYSSANFWHYANTTYDPSSWNWTFSGAPTSVIVGNVDFQGVDQSSPIDTSNIGVDTSGSTHTSPTVTTALAQEMLYTSYGYTSTTTTTPPTGPTTIWNVQSGSSNGPVSLFSDYQLQGLGGQTVGGVAVSTNRNVIAMMHSILIKPALPVPQLIAPANGANFTASSTFQMVSATLVGPLQYIIQICSSANCPTGSVLNTYDQRSTQAGWSGQDANTSTAYNASTDVNNSTVATYTVQTPLTSCTTYYWRAQGYDTQISEVYNYSLTRSFHTNCPPSAPTLYTPLNGSTGNRFMPEFRLASTDADADYLKYKIQLCADSACNTILSTWDQTTGQTGWSGQDANNFTAYTGDTSSPAKSMQAYYTAQTALTGGSTYYWRAYATDPAGTGTWSAASSIASFTVNTAETRILNGQIQSGKIL